MNQQSENVTLVTGLWCKLGVRDKLSLYSPRTRM